MKRILLLAVLALSAAPLSACDPTGPISSIPSSPAAAADKTVLDEKIALGVEATYQAARSSVEVAVDAGLVKGAAASRLRILDNRAYAAVKAVRAAYSAGNATTYYTASVDAYGAISQLVALAGGK